MVYFEETYDLCDCEAIGGVKQVCILEKFYNGLVSRALGMIISLSGIIIASRILF